MPFDTSEVMRLLALGLFSGAIGGLVGLGGSIIIIPILTILLHHDLHVAQGAAMIVNVFVAVPAALQHHRAEAIRWVVFARMLPFALVFIVVGVEVSNRVDTEVLKRIFGCFLLYVIAYRIQKTYLDRTRGDERTPRESWLPVGIAGGLMGFFAGLLGIGGGPVVIPVLQRVCQLRLRESIATSSAVMCLTAMVGAARKNWAIPGLTDAAGMPLQVSESLWLAACLAPTATVGAYVGARLTHALPLAWVRLAFLLLMAWASAQMLRGG